MLADLGHAASMIRRFPADAALDRRAGHLRRFAREPESLDRAVAVVVAGPLRAAPSIARERRA
jgi:hypothetical protein